jgi:hypothetical protein
MFGIGWGSLSGGAGMGIFLGALVFFPWNALMPLHGRWILGQAIISFIAGQVLGIAIVALYHRVFDVKDV